MGLSGWTYNAGGTSWNPDSGIGTLGYREEKDSGRSSFTASNSSGERTFFVDWDQVDIFLQDLLGWGYWTGATLKRILPDNHPFFTNFYATGATVEPWGSPGKDPSITFTKKKYWKVQATYEPVDYAVLADADTTLESDRFCSFKYGFQTQFLTTSSYFQFENSTNKIAAQPAIRTSNMQIQITWHLVPSLDATPFRVPVESKIKTYSGLVNSVAFLGFPAGTVQFVGADPQFAKPKSSSTVGDTGLYTWDICYTFLIKDEGASAIYAGERIGWQYSYDLKAGQWDHVRSLVGNRLPFLTGDLNELFKL